MKKDDVIRDRKSVSELEQNRHREGFRCKQCGNCCFRTCNVDIYPEDIKRWEKEGRVELLSDDMMIEWDDFGASGLFRNEFSFRCPFLRKIRGKDKYYCKLQDSKPLFCRQFPRTREYAKSYCDCPGFD